MPRTRALKKQNDVTPITVAEKKPPTDLAALFRNPTAILEIPDPRFKEYVDSGIRIEISSFKSQEAMEVFQEYHEKLRLVTDEEEKEPLLNETLIKQLVTVTKRWWHEGETTDGIYIRPGELLACTADNKRMVYTTDGWDWLVGFVADRFLKEASFFGERPKTA